MHGIYKFIGISKIFKFYREKLGKEEAVCSKDISDYPEKEDLVQTEHTQVDLNIQEVERKIELSREDANYDPVDHTTFIDCKENRHGNYSHYIERVFRTAKVLNQIDFLSKVKDKSIVLPNLDEKKLTVIIDLDETLIHSDFRCQYGDYDEVLEFTFENESVSIPLIIRPGVRDFLKYIQDKFNIMIFTAGRKDTLIAF
jgi:hypothetical protein